MSGPPETGLGGPGSAGHGGGLALRLCLGSGACRIPLNKVHHLAGYATLAGAPDDYFLGWLMFHGEQVPVFDLNRVVCDQATPETFGSRIILMSTCGQASTALIGLLAAGLTDTVSAGMSGPARGEAVSGPEAPLLDLDQYLPMLYTLIPAPPAEPVRSAAAGASA